MRSMNEMRIDDLRAALAEACCDNCGAVGKAKRCCDKKGAPERIAPESETGQDVIVRTEEAHFIYEFPSESRAKSFVREAESLGWRFLRQGKLAGMMTKAAADELAAKYGGADSVSPHLSDAFRAQIQNEAKEKSTTHPFIKRCVAAITGKDAEPDRAEVSRAFAICTAQKKRSPKAAAAKKKEGVPKARMADYERALSSARESDKK